MTKAAAAEKHKKQQTAFERQRAEMQEKAKDFDFISMMLEKLGMGAKQ